MSVWLVVVCAASAYGQDDTQVVGDVRDVARQVLLAPLAFDPTLLLAMTSAPQAAIAVSGGGLTGSARIGFQNGDDGYGIGVAGPIANVGAAPTPEDLRGLRAHAAFGFDVTNVIWRPRGTAALRDVVGPDAAARLTPAQRDAVRRLITSGEGVEASWAVFFNVSYRFSRDAYDYAAAPGLPLGRSDHLNDAATVSLGTQLLARSGDPGVFVGLSYIYSAVFLDAPATSGVPIGAPTKLRSDDVRLEVRRPFANGRAGVTPAVTYDTDARSTAVDVAAYAFGPRSWLPEKLRGYAAVHAGYKEGFGAFASVTLGTLFEMR